MKIILFDLDGTLLNTLEDLNICFNFSIEKYGYPKRTREEIRSFVGNGIKKAIERALPSGVASDEIIKITDFFKCYYPEHMFEHTKPYDGIKDMLFLLKEKGYKTGVISNKYDEAVKKLCKNYFDGLIDCAVGESENIKKKPEPDGILAVLKELNGNTDRDEILYIGDSEVDIQTAKNAGVPCVCVLWGFKDKEFLLKNGGKFFAETPKDIIKIIEKKIYLE